jgi:hypothetical protein
LRLHIRCIENQPGDGSQLCKRYPLWPPHIWRFPGGAEVVGLGALTGPATGGGLSIVRELSRKVILTNGNALTAAIVRQKVITAARSLCDPREAIVAIVGCTAR